MIEKRRSLPPTTTAKKPSTCDYPQHYSNNIYQQQPTQQQSTGGRNRRHTRCLSDYGELIRNKHSSKDCPIGTGAFATVILTRRKDKYSNTTSLYAIKVFQPTRYIRSEAHFMKKIISEFCISSSLQHPNIVKTIDLVLDEKNRFCTVMEYCSGGDLYNFIKEGRLTCIDEINGYFKQLLNGLAYLHRIGVAHRDIKPENLLLVGEGTLKITDFGEADVFREAHHQQKEYKLSDGFCGSTPYIAPEIFLWAKQGYKASQADVWSAGIVYFCMRFNGVPFYSATQSDTNYRLYQKCFYTYHQQQQPFRDLDSDAKDMLYSMLNPDPEQRYTIQDVLNIPWLAEVRPPTEEIEENTSQYYDTPQRPSQHLEHCSQCFDDTNTTTVRDANYRRSIA
ncbi:kinase-like domain-containing protein [Mycotypha africana]|uniref:kinase-like domain-containing protein n=1 Tax=Mycotypha africana TaxID=64632 RepID=UPI002300605E|nr:kinase-like domain-containing protein [Mycotypha africana]KAI8979131.1 kinase-like domain-containing protein [Mycotypha africana]